MNAEVQPRPASGSAIAGWICFGIGAFLVFVSPWLFLLYVPLFIASFVLGIVAMVQKRVGQGLAILLLTVFGPFVIAGVSAGMKQMNRQLALSSAGASATSMPTSSAPAAPPLQIVDWECRLDGRYSTIEGHLKNMSDRRLDSLRVTGSFYAEDGKSLGSGSSIVEFTALLPQQETPFKLYGPHVAGYKTCKIDGITEGLLGGTLAYSVK